MNLERKVKYGPLHNYLIFHREKKGIILLDVSSVNLYKVEDTIIISIMKMSDKSFLNLSTMMAETKVYSVSLKILSGSSTAGSQYQEKK